MRDLNISDVNTQDLTVARRIVRIMIPLVAAALALAPELEAQFPRTPRGGSQRTEPQFYASLWVGYHQLQPVDDGTSGSTWDFGSAAEYRATLEYSIGNESTLGVAGRYAKMPLVYSTFTGSGVCARCDADAVVQSIEGFFHIGGRPGFHQVIELGAGFTQFRDFRARQGKVELPPKSDTDFSFSLAYGFGY